LRDAENEFASRGVRVVVVGMGTPDMARHFKSEQKIPFTLLVDTDQQTYKAFDLGRSATAAVGPQVWLKYARTILKGRGMAPPKQDWQQLGGVLVIDEDGRLLLAHRAKNAADNPPIQQLLEIIQ
jgi:AhpC/TSA antioxidant enzyme